MADEHATITVTCPTATVGPVTYPTPTTWEVEVSDLASGLNTFTVTDGVESYTTTVQGVVNHTLRARVTGAETTRTFTEGTTQQAVVQARTKATETSQVSVRTKAGGSSAAKASESAVDTAGSGSKVRVDTSSSEKAFAVVVTKPGAIAATSVHTEANVLAGSIVQAAVDTAVHTAQSASVRARAGVQAASAINCKATADATVVPAGNTKTLRAIAYAGTEASQPVYTTVRTASPTTRVLRAIARIGTEESLPSFKVIETSGGYQATAIGTSASKTSAAASVLVGTAATAVMKVAASALAKISAGTTNEATNDVHADGEAVVTLNVAAATSASQSKTYSGAEVVVGAKAVGTTVETSDYETTGSTGATEEAASIVHSVGRTETLRAVTKPDTTPAVLELPDPRVLLRVPNPVIELELPDPVVILKESR